MRVMALRLRAPYLLVAQHLQEAVDATDVGHNDLWKWLSDACCEMGENGGYCCLVDFIGDGESGEAICYCDGDMIRAPYEIQRAGDRITAVIHKDQGEDVLPCTTYIPEADEDDHMAAMEAALYTPGPMPLCERFISKSERKSASSGSFAGKGRSFPILKASDVMAAVRSMGRAGSENFDTATLKRNIIRIAKAKGFTSELPKAWRDEGGDSKESASSEVQSGDVILRECATWCEEVELRESARADYEIKLIAPGKGSSAYYPADVLKRDGPKVFGSGTHVYLNHPTQAEEASRPEGDVKNLAGVLTTSAVYHESHAKGPGLYARMKVFADHASTLEDKAAHVGMSIRASGVAESGKSRDGVPVLKELTRAESVDVVTKAGAGGMILTEAARTAANQSEVSEMDDTAVQKLVESAVKAAQAPLIERAIRGDAREEATKILSGISLHESAKALVIDTVLRNIPQKNGALDVAVFTEAVNAEAKRIGAVVAAATGAGQVRGMGMAAPEADPTKVAAREAAEKKLREAAVDSFKRIMGSDKAAEFAAKGRYQ